LSTLADKPKQDHLVPINRAIAEAVAAPDERAATVEIVSDAPCT